MKIKRFFAKDMRTALSEVKEELGADAVIMSNKKVTGGVEIVAAVDTDIANEPPKASQNTRDALANRLGQAKRKLAEDQVQIKQSAASRFASVLQNYTGDKPKDSSPEPDSLSALLNRQSKQHGESSERHSYDRSNSDNRGGRSPSALQAHNKQPPQRESHAQGQGNYRNMGDGHRAGSDRFSGEHSDNRQSGYSARGMNSAQQSKANPLDFGDYRRPYPARNEKPQNEPRQREQASEFGRGRDSRAESSFSHNSSRFNQSRLDPSRYDAKSPHSNDEMETMRSEMSSIRSLLEHQLSGLMWQEVERREPMRAMMIKRLEKMGLSSELADQFASYIPEDVPAHEAWPALLDLLADQIITTSDCILETGGVVALLGPTGVGKTTTIAKLAARAAMDFGADEIALVTTDTYRIGAHEQLATYGRIMGCPVRVAKDAEELADILHQLRHRRLVLLDTAGMGQRDIRLSEQLDTLMQNSGAHIRSFLVLPSTAQRRVLQETIEHFRRIPLSGCVLTKLDESLSLGEVMCVTIQNALPIAYLADGQRVPEDIKVATGNYLVSRANELLEQEISQQSHFWSSDSSENKAADYYD
ncbi:flagellar biosynthesis protein FlhF [Photobacterium indicum]|uniref:Flagellar biosynthesis protein FlhF n=1 Tax=Photobacterium indicum TaxID=81447 RepID=A0A2T3LBJ5_9GAMM|nr:flagellar biosynthesis protein FlhF [Photobacterium indicum]PSV48709.1 flagellar biosynthesis protein FlhF [Photobacterium indicum]